MGHSRRGRSALSILFLAAAAAAVGTWGACGGGSGSTERSGFLEVDLDRSGPYLVLATAAARRDFSDALAEIDHLHPEAKAADLDVTDLHSAREALLAHQPRFALLVLEPGEIDVNFAWSWLDLTTGIDEDPFVDVRSGFVTGDSPDSAARFVRRIAEAVEGKTRLPAAFVDHLGPNPTAAPESFSVTPAAFMIPVLARKMPVSTISHGRRGFSQERLGSLSGAGLVHFGGHGYPDGIVDCLRGPWVRKLELSACVVFNGACYTGVAGRWFETSGMVREHTVAPNLSFGLGMLSNDTVAYLAALHADHGMPVYQEMEFMAVSGASLGEVLKYTHDGVILGAGGRLPEWKPLKEGDPDTARTPADIMLRGTAARVLFGDPALEVGPAFAEPAFEVSAEPDGEGSLIVTAVLNNDELRAGFTDTYHSDLAAVENGFNDRALVGLDLPDGFGPVDSVEVVEAEGAGGKKLSHRLVGWGVEIDGGRRRILAQVDLPSSGYMQSEFRARGSFVRLRLTAK